LGRAFAFELARRSYDLALVALPNSGLEDAAAEATERYGVEASCLALDLREAHGALALYTWLREQSLPVSVLVNNAGVGQHNMLHEAPLDRVDDCMAINNVALVRITRLLLPDLMRCAPAYVLNVSSLSAFFPMPLMAVYSASKAFTLAFSLALREEMRGSGVRVSALCPNAMRTSALSRSKIQALGGLARMTCLDVDRVAAYAVKRLLSGAAVIVPGVVNQVLAWIGRHAPRPWVYAAASTFWGRTASCR
jgi:short-subunit dehydrogenase